MIEGWHDCRTEKGNIRPVVGHSQHCAETTAERQWHLPCWFDSRLSFFFMYIFLLFFRFAQNFSRKYHCVCTRPCRRRRRMSVRVFPCETRLEGCGSGGATRVVAPLEVICEAPSPLLQGPSDLGCSVALWRRKSYPFEGFANSIYITSCLPNLITSNRVVHLRPPRHQVVQPAPFPELLSHFQLPPASFRGSPFHQDLPQVTEEPF